MTMAMKFSYDSGISGKSVDDLSVFSSKGSFDGQTSGHNGVDEFDESNPVYDALKKVSNLPGVSEDLRQKYSSMSFDDYQRMGANEEFSDIRQMIGEAGPAVRAELTLHPINDDEFRADEGLQALNTLMDRKDDINRAIRRERSRNAITDKVLQSTPEENMHNYRMMRGLSVLLPDSDEMKAEIGSMSFEDYESMSLKDEYEAIEHMRFTIFPSPESGPNKYMDMMHKANDKWARGEELSKNEDKILRAFMYLGDRWGELGTAYEVQQEREAAQVADMSAESPALSERFKDYTGLYSGRGSDGLSL